MSNIFTGARAQVRIGGKVVAFASGVNVTVEHTLTDVDVLGLLEVADLAETAHKCNFSMNVFKPLSRDGKSAPSANSQVAQSNAAEAGIDSSYASSNGVVGAVATVNMLYQTEFDCDIIDELTGNPVFVMQGCKYQGGSGTVDARGIWTGSWNFKCKRGAGV